MKENWFQFLMFWKRKPMTFPPTMADKVFCLNCDLLRDCDVHGACESCGSFANVPIERIGWKPPKRVSRKAREVKELEKIYASGGAK